MSDNKNVLLAVVLSIGVLFAWQFFFATPHIEAERQAQKEDVQRVGTQSPGEAFAPPAPGVTAEITREQALSASPRIRIDSQRLSGSLSLQGARIDDLSLKNYGETVDPNSERIVLLTPRGALNAYYAEFGWQGLTTSPVAVPDRDTLWGVQGEGSLTPDTPVILTWDNGAGLLFTRRIAFDRDFLFTITDSVTNSGTEPVTLFPFGFIARHGTPNTTDFFILHEGFVGVFLDEEHQHSLEEVEYEDAEEKNAFSYKSNGGWLGITDKYWLAALIPAQNMQVNAAFRHVRGATPVHQTDFQGPAQLVAPGATIELTTRFFAGAKEVEVLDRYQEKQAIPRFELAIDWGMFYFLTKPLFRVIHYIYGIVGNFGIAILILTVLVKLLFFPLANKSYVAMSRMKKLQPEMMKLRERYKDDKVQQQKELMALYQREKVNPLAGCLPILIQIPVFFALYKMLFVTIEMRHTPFFGWIRDLAAPDPTSLFNLFGLLPYDVPGFLVIGIWPILMGITMYLQTSMNPAPADPVQQKIFAFMPLFFTFLLASFPAGLVIYWTWNNFLSILQQYVIMRRQGVSISWHENFSWLGKIPGLSTLFREKNSSAANASGKVLSEKTASKKDNS
jgi:YidC/Oxa1 family membrane protein insertase